VKRASGVSAAVLVCVLVGRVHAEPDRYWGRFVVTDATVPVLLLAAGFSCFEGCTQSTYLLAGLTAGMYFVVPPLMHLGRGNRRNALRSAALRTGIPLLGATLGSPFTENTANGAFLAGAAVAMVADWILAKDTVIPYATRDDGAAIVGVVARF